MVSKLDAGSVHLPMPPQCTGQTRSAIGGFGARGIRRQREFPSRAARSPRTMSGTARGSRRGGSPTLKSTGSVSADTERIIPRPGRLHLPRGERGKLGPAVGVARLRSEVYTPRRVVFATTARAPWGEDMRSITRFRWREAVQAGRGIFAALALFVINAREQGRMPSS
jgi:hypothetical protein